MALCKTLTHRSSQQDARIRQSQRCADARQDKILVALVGPQRERVPKQAKSQVCIFIMSARVETQGMTGKKRVELFNRVARIGIVAGV